MLWKETEHRKLYYSQLNAPLHPHAKSQLLQTKAILNITTLYGTLFDLKCPTKRAGARSVYAEFVIFRSYYERDKSTVGS